MTDEQVKTYWNTLQGASGGQCSDLQCSGVKQIHGMVLDIGLSQSEEGPHHPGLSPGPGHTASVWNAAQLGYTV